MRIYAYPENFLGTAMNNIGSMFDYAINDFGLHSDDFVTMFICSKVCRGLERGEYRYLIGMSGTELAIRVIEETTGIEVEDEPTELMPFSPDHWVGWVIAYYQWWKNIPYKEIFRIATYEELLHMYRTLHEADITKFAEVMDDKRAKRIKDTNLKRFRSAYGCSQSELAKKSGVSLRSIQMYEQRNKDINKGQLATIASLAKVLGCRAEDLLEPV